ncbi:MAG TPA: alpha/beta hydrolase [Acidimicrobiia bacterium]|nr:alpha/beta hydrolase [Acidimicrobiia bacterium]
MDIAVAEWGAGPRVVLVHGALASGESAWRRQRPLGERWNLVVPSRRGYVPNPPADSSDFDVDADDVAELLGEGAHLVGHSYGGLVATLAAARRPDAVWSLCLLEPATMALLPDDPDVARDAAQHAHRQRTVTDPREFLVGFLAMIGAPPADLPDPLPPDLAQHTRVLMGERPPFDAVIPSESLATAEFPKLVVSGGHDPIQERTCDATAAAFGAERASLVGAGHQVPRADGCNELLEGLWVTRSRTGVN